MNSFKTSQFNKSSKDGLSSDAALVTKIKKISFDEYRNTWSSIATSREQGDYLI